MEKMIMMAMSMRTRKRLAITLWIRCNKEGLRCKKESMLLTKSLAKYKNGCLTPMPRDVILVEESVNLIPEWAITHHPQRNH